MLKFCLSNWALFFIVTLKVLRHYFNISFLWTHILWFIIVWLFETFYWNILKQRQHQHFKFVPAYR